jgi:hypothetical protein
MVYLIIDAFKGESHGYTKYPQKRYTKHTTPVFYVHFHLVGCHGVKRNIQIKCYFVYAKYNQTRYAQSLNIHTRLPHKTYT